MEILIIALLILLNGVFSMSEIALVSSRKFKLEAAAKKGSKSAERALNLSNNPNTFLSTVQIGITLIGILTGIYSGDKITNDLKVFVENIAVLRPYSNTIAVGMVVIIVTFFSIVFGELIPKRIGLIFPEAIASFVAGPMKVISTITKPFIWILGATNDFFFQVFGIKSQGPAIVSEEEIKSIVQESAERGEILDIEQEIVRRVFALGDRKVRELMTHRSEIVWLDINDTFEEIKRKTKNGIHSVYPVANKELDKLEGLLHIKDFFLEDISRPEFTLKEYLRKPLFIAENSSAYKLFEEFKKSQVHHAVVLDEYGSIEGIISFNDILDSLVGDYIDDDDDEYKIIKRDENSWLADGQFSFHEFTNYFRLEDIDETDFNTLGGLILEELGHIPAEGEKIVWRDFEMEVVDMDERRIDKILISRLT